MNARTTEAMLCLLAGAFGLAAGGTAKGYPPVDFFYTIHIHVPNDYATPSQTEFNDIAHTVSRLADVLEAHGARGTFEAVYMFADAARLYQGAGNNILTQLVARGHEVAAHAHNGNMFQLGYTALLNAGVQNITTIGGRTAIPGNATTFADGVQLAADVGFTVKTDNWSPTDTFGGATWCTDFGLGGNTMYTATNNIIHPWRPDYINRDVCAHNPAGQVVYVDHAIPNWLQGLRPLTDAQFDVLKPWFEAALQNVDSQQVNAWGFVSHQVEYDYPGTWTVSEDAIAALGRFLTYVDGFVAQGNVRYATARDIATRFVQWESTPPTEQPVYILFNNHVEGDFGMQPGNLACAALIYQTATLPPPGQPNPGPSFDLDIVGTELIRNVLDSYTDTVSQTPKVFICPAGEFWQTEADPVYGGRLFDTHNYLARGDEFGIQGHGIYYSGQSFCWYNSAHTPEGIQQKLSDLHFFAQQVMYQGQPVNHGLTLTGGSKLEAPTMGTAAAEWSIDHAAFDLGYRISYEDHDGHVEDEPAEINNARAGYYLYRADYGDGVRMWKIDMNGSVTAGCGGGTARCETPAEAIARLDATLAARAADPNPRQIYYAAFVIHAGGVWDDYHRAAGGDPMIGEGLGLVTLMDAVQARVNARANLRFVTPAELVGLHVAPGDFDADGDVDLTDFAQFEICFTGPGGALVPGCEPGDFDGDNDIDCDDWAQFVLAWTDPGQPPQLPQCAVQAIPAVSQWGSASMGLLLLTAATIVLRRERSVRTPYGAPHNL